MYTIHKSMKFGLLALVVTIALAATMVLIGSQPAAGEGGTVAPELEGTWLATISIESGGPPPFEGLNTYARGGALIVTDGGVPPASGYVYQGSWTKTGPGQFSSAFLGFKYDATTGARTGYIRIHETDHLQPDGKTYDGVATIEILDTAQNVIVTVSATSHATRISAQ